MFIIDLLSVLPFDKFLEGVVSKKRREAPLSSDNLESECIVDLKHCVEDEVVENAVVEYEVVENEVVENQVVENEAVENAVVENEVVENSEVENEADPASKNEEEGQHVKMFHSTLAKGYDCITADPTYVCVFCNHQPHRYGLGDLFGPYYMEKGGRY